MTPLLIEVNSSPSMNRETNLDSRIKTKLIEDVVNLVDPPGFDRTALLECFKRLGPRGSSHLRQSQRSSIFTSERNHTEQMLKGIMSKALPRTYGETPEHLGLFVRLAPGTESYEKLVSCL